MRVVMKATLSDGYDGDEIEVELTHEDFGLDFTPAKDEEIVNAMAAKLARKVLAARAA